MEILVYLAELIQHRKQVGIAGLGTIYKSKVPGRYDAEAHAFLPPSYTLHFSTELLEKDTLAEYISFKRNISVDSAHYFIEQFSDRAVQELSEKNETQLDGLGKLRSVDGSIVFEPAEDITSAYFGLPKVNEEELTRLHNAAPLTIEQAEDDFVEDMSADTEDAPVKEEEAIQTEEAPEVLDIKTNEAETPPVPEKVEEIVEENRREEENPGMENPDLIALLPTEINKQVGDGAEEEEIETRDFSYLKVILAAVLVLVILALAYYLYPKMMTANKAEIEESQLLDSLAYQNQTRAADSAAYSDSIQNAALAVDTNAVDTTAISVNAAPPVAEKPAVTTYEIVIGSLANMKEAKKFIAQIKSKGINGWVVDSLTRGKIRVSIATFTDREMATKERRKIVKNLKDPSIYIYTNKPKK